MKVLVLGCSAEARCITNLWLQARCSHLGPAVDPAPPKDRGLRWLLHGFVEATRTLKQGEGQDAGKSHQLTMGVLLLKSEKTGFQASPL